MINKQQDDTLCINEWRALIGVFNSLINGNPEPKTIEKELLALKEQAKLSANLTYRQVDAILCRVDNYLKGEYGNTKKGVKMQTT